MSVPVFPHDVLFWAQPLDRDDGDRIVSAANGLARTGWRLLLAWGGTTIPDISPGVTLAPLPPSQPLGGGATAGDEGGSPADPAWKKRRTAALLALFAQTRPRLLLLDRFPFSHAGYRYELRPLMEMAHRRHPAPALYTLGGGDNPVEAKLAGLLTGRAASRDDLPPAPMPYGSGET